MGKEVMMEERRQSKDAEEWVFTSICLTLNPYVDCLIADSCAESSPADSEEVHPARVSGQEAIRRCFQLNFCFLRSGVHDALLWADA